MSSKTKIVVLRMKEIIYTAIFIGLGILLILLLLVMFRPKKESSAAPASAQYIPGVYASSITLGAQEVNVEVSVDANRITSVTLVPLSDAVATMYPLMQPSLNNLTRQDPRQPVPRKHILSRGNPLHLPGTFTGH